MVALAVAVGAGSVGAGAAGATPRAAVHARATTTQSAILTAPGGESQDSLGTSVAVSGTTIVTGAVNHDDGAGDGEGAVYVFEKPAAGWGRARSPVARLTPSDGAAGDQFGTSVAITGRTIVVGAPFHGVGGALYVFVEPTGGWRTGHETAELTAAGTGGQDGLGESVAVSGRTVVGGAPFATVGSSADQGAVEVYTEPGGGWASTDTSSITLTAADGGEEDGFGGSVAAAAGDVVVGSPAHKVGTAAREGAAYVYVEPAAGWSAGPDAVAELLATDARAKAMVGTGVAIDPTGHTVVVGAGGGDPDVFVEPAGGWSGVRHEAADLTGAGSTRSDDFGSSVAISGGLILAGAPLQTTGLVPSAGAAYTFVRPGPAWRSTSHPDLAAQASFPNYFDELGGQVAAAPGLLVAGARERDVNGHTDQGALFVFAAPTLSVVTVSHPAFHEGSRLPTVDPRLASSPGTVLRFTDDQAATARVTFRTRRGDGLRVAGSFEVAVPPGRVRLAFAGRLSSIRRLAPGRYRVTVTVRDAVGPSTTRTVHLTVRRST